MPDPVSPSASVVAAGLSSGLVGAMLVPLGLTWPLVLWGSIGCVVGLSWAPSVGRLRAGALFAAAAMLSAKGGAMAAFWWWNSSVDVAQGISAALGVVFHPAVQWAVGNVGEVLKAIPLPKRPS